MNAHLALYDESGNVSHYHDFDSRDHALMWLDHKFFPTVSRRRWHVVSIDGPKHREVTTMRLDLIDLDTSYTAVVTQFLKGGRA